MRVNLRDEVANYGLRLCASDLKLVNFMKDKDGRIVAVDYGGYSFLPPSFFALALGYGAFAHELSTMLKYPLCKDDTTALVTASCALAPFDTNNIGEQISLLSLLCFLSKKICLLPPCTNTELTIRHRRSETAPVQASLLNAAGFWVLPSRPSFTHCFDSLSRRFALLSLAHAQCIYSLYQLY